MALTSLLLPIFSLDSSNSRERWIRKVKVALSLRAMWYYGMLLRGMFVHS